MKERLKVLKQVFPMFIKHIDKFKHLFLSPKGLHSNYGEGEKYSMGHVIRTMHKGKTYEVSYRMFVTIKEI